jgi:hypothetical protein
MSIQFCLLSQETGLAQYKRQETCLHEVLELSEPYKHMVLPIQLKPNHNPVRRVLTRFK